MELLTKQMTAAQGLTVELKAMDQMAWAGIMNSIRTAGEEVVLQELIHM